jgi:ribosomal protein L16 Arg81 hydroxylase
MTALKSEAPSTLADFVSPLTESEFLGLLRRRELAYRPGANGDRYVPLLGWSGLRRIIAGNYPGKQRDNMRVTKESVIVPSGRWMTQGKVDFAKLEKFLADGFSIVVLHVDEHVPALAAVCSEIRSRTLEGSFVGAIVTSGTGTGAFKLHYDPEDLVILQVEGTKRWQIFGPPVSNPLRRMLGSKLSPKPPETEPIFDEVLEPGDLLFVPAGNWHHCEGGLSTSVHIGIFFLPPTGWHAANEILRPFLSEELFRTPLTRLDGASAIEEAEAEVKSRLIEKISELKLNEFIAGWSKVAY